MKRRRRNRKSESRDQPPAESSSLFSVVASLNLSYFHKLRFLGRSSSFLVQRAYFRRHLLYLPCSLETFSSSIHSTGATYLPNAKLQEYFKDREENARYVSNKIRFKHPSVACNPGKKVCIKYY